MELLVIILYWHTGHTDLDHNGHSPLLYCSELSWSFSWELLCVDLDQEQGHASLIFLYCDKTSPLFLFCSWFNIVPGSQLDLISNSPMFSSLHYGQIVCHAHFINNSPCQMKLLFLPFFPMWTLHQSYYRPMIDMHIEINNSSC